MKNRKGRTRGTIIEAVLALIIGFVIVISIPELKAYFDRLFNAVLTGVILGLVVAVIIFGIWIFVNKNY